MNDGDRFHPEFRVKKGFKKKRPLSAVFFALSTLNEERPTLQKKKNECSLVNVVSSVSSLEKGIYLITKQKLAKEGRENKMRR